MSLPSTPRRKSLGAPQRGILKRFSDENHTIALDPQSMAKKRVSFKSEASVLQIKENNSEGSASASSSPHAMGSPGIFRNFQGRISFGLTSGAAAQAKSPRFEVYQDEPEKQREPGTDDVLDLFYDEGEIEEIKQKSVDEADDEDMELTQPLRIEPVKQPAEVEEEEEEEMEFTQPVKPIQQREQSPMETIEEDTAMEMTVPLKPAHEQKKAAIGPAEELEETAIETTRPLEAAAATEEEEEPMEITRPLKPTTSQEEYEPMEITRPLQIDNTEPMELTKPLGTQDKMVMEAVEEVPAMEFTRSLEPAEIARPAEPIETAELEESESQPMELTQPVQPTEPESLPVEPMEPAESQSQPMELTQPVEAESQPMELTQPLGSQTRVSFREPMTPTFKELVPESQESGEMDESIIEPDYEPTETFAFFKEIGIDFREYISPHEPEFKPNRYETRPTAKDYVLFATRAPDLALVMHELCNMIKMIQERRLLISEAEQKLTSHNTRLMRDYKQSDSKIQKQLRSMFLNTRDVKKYSTGFEFYNFKLANLDLTEVTLGEYKSEWAGKLAETEEEISKLQAENGQLRRSIGELKARILHMRQRAISPDEFSVLKRELLSKSERLVALRLELAESESQLAEISANESETRRLVTAACATNAELAQKILQNQDVKQTKLRFAMIERLSQLRLVSQDGIVRVTPLFGDEEFYDVQDSQTPRNLDSVLEQRYRNARSEILGRRKRLYGK